MIGTLLLVALVNDAFALGLVGQYSKQVMVALGATAFVALYRAGVFARAAGASADEGSNKRAKPRHQALLLGVIWCFAIGLVLVVTAGPFPGDVQLSQRGSTGKHYPEEATDGSHGSLLCRVWWLL